MDSGRYGFQQGWENNSDLNAYGAVHEPNFRAGPYDDRRYLNERYPKDNVYSRGSFRRDMLHGETYPQPHMSIDLWPQTRRSYGHEHTSHRDIRRNERSHPDLYHDVDSIRDSERYQGPDSFEEYDKFRDRHRVIDNFHDRFDRYEPEGCDDYAYDDYDRRSRSRSSHERDLDYGKHSYDSDYDRGGRRESGRKRRHSREHDRERKFSGERDHSPQRRRDRSLSYSRDECSRSRSPRARSLSHSHREDYSDNRYDRFEKRRDDDKIQLEHHSAAPPSGTIVVKGLPQKTTEEDLYQILAEWGPLRHVRVIKERNSGISRGFAFIDFPSVGAAKAMMEKIGDESLFIDGRKLFFEYSCSSKPTGASGGHYGQESAVRPSQTHYRGITIASDWMCVICGCVNFARRTSCFQCNEARTDDSPPADMLSSSSSSGRRGETGPSHVLVVRGLDENADEDLLRYEFSKHVPIKDLRLVRDRFTHVSRGFAFVHFYSVEDAAKALEATNGTTLEKKGQVLRVAYAKSVIGPSPNSSGNAQSSSLAAAAIEAATFAQQYDAVGWAPKEYNPDDKQSSQGQQKQQNGSAPQSGFVWDETSGYYYDAASGFYYDGNTGLYYDSNSGAWYSYDQKTQQYVPCTGNTEKQLEASKASNSCSKQKVVISAPATAVASSEKATSLPDAVQAAAAAAIAAEKKEKEKAKEIKLSSKSSILANKKKMSNVLTKWKQRSHEGQAPRVAVEEINTEDKPTPAKSMLKHDRAPANAQSDSSEKPRPVRNSVGGTVMGVIRGSGRSISKPDTPASTRSASPSSEMTTTETPFRTNAAALGSYAPAPSATAGKRRFSETPQVTYRDRAAERRSLYGSLSSHADDSDDSDLNMRRGGGDSMPFPPGVGGGGGQDVIGYEVITAERAIDENNVGNRMLRNMGWHEGSGLGKDGSGMVEPVMAQAMDSRAGLGSQQARTDPSLEVQVGDTYRTVIQKKALARFREMS